MSVTCTNCQSPIPEDAAKCPHCGSAAPTSVSVDAATVPYMPSAAGSAPVTVQEKLAEALGSNYQVRRAVGRGGFAEVYEVWDRNLERRLAAKVLIPEVAATPGVIDRFKHEARTVARLNHPNILHIHFVGDAEDLAFYVMPFVEGESLKDLLDRDKLPTAEAIGIAKPILGALAHAHDSGLVHRDIKPDNVMIESKSGRVLLVDFGIAKALDPQRASNLTQAGFTVGTPHYMSPEQGLGDQIDARSDLYSLGAMFFEMVTGEKLFDGETVQEIVTKHVTDQTREAIDVDESVPVWLSDLIARCVQKKPQDRFQSADEVLDAIEAQGATDSASGAVEMMGGAVIQGSGYEFDMMLEATIPKVEDSMQAQPEPPAPHEKEPTTEQAPPPPSPPPSPPLSQEEPAASPEAPPQPSEVVAEHPAAEPEQPEPEEPEQVEQPPEAEPDLSSYQETARKFEADVAERKRKEEAERRKRRMTRAVTVPLVVISVGVGGWFAVSGGRFERVMSVWAGLLGNAPGLGGFAGETRSDRQASPEVPTQYVTNSLVAPVQILVNGRLERQLSPGERLALPIVGDLTPQLSWRLVRPTQNGQRMGRQFSAVLMNAVQRGESQHFSVTGMTANRSIFAPLITNPTSNAWVVLVNAGTPDEARCNCVVPPGSMSTHIGYYPLLQNTSVRFYDTRQPYGGIYREISDVSARVNALSGSVELTVPR